MFVYDGFELLDLAGPASAFNAVNMISKHLNYHSVVVSEKGNSIQTSGGIEVSSQPISHLKVDNNDTIIVTGADSLYLNKVRKNSNTIRWLKDISFHCERMCSVCSGSFLLAETDLLNNRQATTHWLLVNQLQTEFPDIKVNSKALFVNDEKFWSSAGVSTGIDMALELIRQDCGAQVMGKVAKGLVLYKQRPGHQPQFSDLLQFQINANNDFSDLISWISNNLHKTIRVEQLSDFMHMTLRTFHRKFTQSTGKTPAKFVEQLRLSRAKELLDENISMKQVMFKCGFRSEAGFRRLFKSSYGLNPSLYRKIHCQTF